MFVCHIYRSAKFWKASADQSRNNNQFLKMKTNDDVNSLRMTNKKNKRAKKIKRHQ